MNLKIEVNREDYLNFEIYHFKKRQLIRTSLIGFLFLLIFQYLMNKDKSSLNILSIALSSLLYISIFFGIIYFFLTKTRVDPDDDKSLLGKREYEFLEDHIFYKVNDSEGRIQWSIIKWLGNSKTAFYFYLDSKRAIIIPKRYFLDKKEEEHFNAYVQGKINAA